MRQWFSDFLQFLLFLAALVFMYLLVSSAVYLITHGP